MEKESKIIISSEDGEWGREPIQNYPNAGCIPFFSNGTAPCFWVKYGKNTPSWSSWTF